MTNIVGQVASRTRRNIGPIEERLALPARSARAGQSLQADETPRSPVTRMRNVGPHSAAFFLRYCLTGCLNGEPIGRVMSRHFILPTRKARAKSFSPASGCYMLHIQMLSDRLGRIVLCSALEFTSPNRLKLRK